MNRRLLTILAADVSGYSKHIETDEEHALQVLALLRQAMDPVIEAHNGRIANSAGDSVIAWFESPVEALRAAIQFQDAHRSINANLPVDQQMYYRVGLNIGDVSEQADGDLLGHGVNVAARLEALAEPGGICLSKNVMDQVEGKIELAFSKVGEHRVKNLARPISVYSVGETGASTRVRRKLARFLKHPALPLFLIFAVAVMSVATFLLVMNERPVGEDKPRIVEVLEKSRGPDEILESFDLVTTGEFDGHIYHVVRTWGGSWEEVEDLARALGGYPVAIGSAEENQFVFELSLREEGHWMVYGSSYEGPMIGFVQSPEAEEPSGGWHWSNGEPNSFVNWSSHGPDNWKGNQHLANFADPRVSKPSPKWGDTPSIHASIVIEVPE